MSHRNTRIVELEVRIKMETAAAYLVDDGPDSDAVEAWLPKSQCRFDGTPHLGETVKVDVPEWLAIEKGMI